MRSHFSHAPKIGAGKQSASHCVHQVLQEEIGSFRPFTPQSAIFFISLLFLMVSINICRVISTFITPAFFVRGYVGCPHLCTSLFEAGNYGSSWLLAAVIDTDKMVWLPPCTKWLADIFCQCVGVSPHLKVRLPYDVSQIESFSLPLVSVLWSFIKSNLLNVMTIQWQLTKNVFNCWEGIFIGC